MRRLILGFVSFGLLAGALGATALPVAASTSRPTIVGIASTTPGFETLTAAVACTGLAPALSGSQKLTVFAPTNSAFAKLGLDAGNVCTLPKATLTNILLYHVTPGSRFASSLLPDEGERTTVRTLLSGQTFKINSTGRIRTSSGGTSQIVATDIRASNGVIHVVDTVLLPGAPKGDGDDNEGDQQGEH